MKRKFLGLMAFLMFFYQKVRLWRLVRNIR